MRRHFAIVHKLTVHTDQPAHRISRHIYGHFAEHLGTGIYDGLWVGEDSAIPNTRGLRADVVAALCKIGVPNIRWPGGCFAETYHWRDGIGPRAKRPISHNCWGRGVIENNHFGTHEFLDLCEQVGAEPYICGNLGGGTVQEMADWLSYLTMPAQSPLSQLRRENGRLDPWPMKYWAVGNENWGCGGHMSAQHYAWEYRRYQTFCRNHSGEKLYKIAGGFEDEWNDILLREGHPYIDGLSIHHYSRIGKWGRDGDPTDFTFSPTGIDVAFAESEWWQIVRLALNMDEFIVRTLGIMDRHDPAHRIGLIIDEWGTWYLEPPNKPKGSVLYQQNTMRDAVVAALTLNIFHAHADRIHMANIAQMVNVLQAMILTDGSRMILTPTYHVFEMYRVHHDGASLPCGLSGAQITVGGQATQTISASASRSDDGAIHLSLCNLHPANSATLDCELLGLAETTPATITGRILKADKMDSHNTFDAPTAVRPEPFTNFKCSAGRILVELPPATVLTLKVLSA